MRNRAGETVNIKTAFAVVLGLGVLGIGSAIYSLPDQPGHANRAQHGSHSQGQIQAPPQPVRVKPLERVVVPQK
ncbi:MAG: hypothetical protein AUI14_12815 [Actinobacteria bacterium 13_2_20CM_2_71_6]|nr:MAG: hypothetical protein AUI14_12815 [Actinobacteria bacterium 13_2_20CM_2_71_6]